MTYKNLSRALFLILPGFLLADSTGGVDFYPASDLQAIAQKLAAKTAPNTHAATVNPLVKYGNDYTIFAYRNADGLAELHEHESDLYVVIDGTATLVSGGAMLDRKEKSPGEYTGSGISNGQSRVLRKGDVVHISPNLPHQLKVKSGDTFSYFVQKVKEQ